MGKGRSIILWPPTAGAQQALETTNKVPTRSLDLQFVYGIRGRDARNCVLVTKEGRVVFMAAALGVVHHLATNSQTYFRGHDAELRCIALHPNGEFVASGQTVGRCGQLPFVCVWNSSSRSLVAIIGKGHFTHAVSSVAFSPASGSLLVTVSTLVHLLTQYTSTFIDTVY